MKPSCELPVVCLAVSLLAAVPARATISPQAKPVVNRFVEVSGGRAAWEKTRAMHFTGSLSAYGLKGTVESWREAPDKRASVVAIGPITIRDWANGAKASRTDPSGKLVALDGKDLEEAIAGAWFDNQRWLEPDQSGGDISVAGEATDSLGTFTVLEVKPPSGRARQLEFDKKTGLLVRILSKHDQMNLVATSSDFRKVDGWGVAFKLVQEVAGMSANTSIVQMELAEFPAAIPDERFTPPAASGAPAVTWLKATGRARLPFDYRAHHVWLHVSVNGGPPGNFILDTGANVTVIDSAFAARTGLKTAGNLQAQGGASTGNASLATVDQLRVIGAEADGVELQNVKVAVVSLSPMMAPLLWRDCDGIIGANVIAQFVTRLDYDRRQLDFLDPKAFTYEGKGTALPMTLTGGVPVVDIKVDGAFEGGARVDVGSDAILDLHTPFVKKNDLLARAGKTIGVTSGSIGGEFQSTIARMKSIEIGPYRMADPLVGLSTTESGALASEDYAGNIGNELLDRFTVTLDYEHRQVWLEPGARYEERRNFSRFGAGLAKYGEEVRATQVTPGSPAAEAGLKEGDVVTAVDGKPAAALDPDLLERQFTDGAPGTKVALTLARDGRSKKLTVKLRDML